LIRKEDVSKPWLLGTKKRQATHIALLQPFTLAAFPPWGIQQELVVWDLPGANVQRFMFLASFFCFFLSVFHELFLGAEIQCFAYNLWCFWYEILYRNNRLYIFIWIFNIKLTIRYFILYLWVKRGIDITSCNIDSLIVD